MFTGVESVHDEAGGKTRENGYKNRERKKEKERKLMAECWGRGIFGRWMHRDGRSLVSRSVEIVVGGRAEAKKGVGVKGQAQAVVFLFLLVTEVCD